MAIPKKNKKEDPGQPHLSSWEGHGKNPFSEPFLATQRTRLSWMASMDSVRAYHAWLTLLRSAKR